MSLFSDISFLMKFISMVLNIVIVVLWAISDRFVIPLHDFSGKFLFYLSVGAYLIILIVFVILYIQGEPPGQNAQRFFVVTGFILFLIGGIFGLLNALNDETTARGMLVAVLMICIGVMLVIDFIKSEGII